MVTVGQYRVSIQWDNARRMVGGLTALAGAVAIFWFVGSIVTGGGVSFARDPVSEWYFVFMVGIATVLLIAVIVGTVLAILVILFDALIQVEPAEKEADDGS